MTAYFVRSMMLSDIRDVEKIHVVSFPNSRSTQLGVYFVRKMYRWFLKNEPGLALVVVKETQLVGFLTGSIGSYGKKVFRYAFFEIILGFISHPSLLLNKKMFLSWHRFWQGVLPGKKDSNLKQYSKSHSLVASVASIAVLPSERGNRIGELLMNLFENSARNQGALSLELSVEADNVAARHLYESCDWKLLYENPNKNLACYTKLIS